MVSIETFKSNKSEKFGWIIARRMCVRTRTRIWLCVCLRCVRVCVCVAWIFHTDERLRNVYVWRWTVSVWLCVHAKKSSVLFSWCGYADDSIQPAKKETISNRTKSKNSHSQKSIFFLRNRWRWSKLKIPKHHRKLSLRHLSLTHFCVCVVKHSLPRSMPTISHQFTEQIIILTNVE